MAESQKFIHKTLLVQLGFQDKHAHMETPIIKKGEKYINGCFLPDEVNKLENARGIVADPGGNVVAIDFGTTCCTLAYSLKGDRENVIRYLRLECDDTRIPTSIVIDDNGTVCAFGRDAQKKYSMLPEEKKLTHHFFHQIKMKLQHDEDVNWSYEIIAINGKHFFLLEVIAMILKHLKDKFLAIEIHGGIYAHLKMEDFKWVITVPAMWKARGKQMMREAAYKAGIGNNNGIITCLTPVLKTGDNLLTTAPSKLSSTSSNPKLLSLALEPEAAAIHCLDQAKKANAQIPDPKCYLVLDIGGGTVDITAHKVNSNGSIDVVLPPTGNDWGGVRVNQKFKEFLAKLVCDTHFQKYLQGSDQGKQARNQAKLQVIIDQTFEDQKKIFGSDEQKVGKYVMINLPYSFMLVYKDTLKKEVEKLNDPNVTLIDSDLCLSYTKLEEIFEQVINNIIPEIDNSFKMLPDDIIVDTVFLVGGFGGCKYTHSKLEAEIKRIFSNSQHIHVFRPDHHRLAVVNGAVESILKSSVIRARIVDASYGSGCSLRFDSTVHDPKQKFYDDDRQENCKNLFLPFALKGDVVQAEHALVQKYCPIRHHQTSMNFDLYSSQAKQVSYVRTSKDEPIEGVNCIGNLQIEMPIQEGDKNREVELVFDFTHSEIQVEAFDLSSKNKMSTVLDFLTDSFCETSKSGNKIL